MEINSFSHTSSSTQHNPFYKQQSAPAGLIGSANKENDPEQGVKTRTRQGHRSISFTSKSSMRELEALKEHFRCEGNDAFAEYVDEEMESRLVNQQRQKTVTYSLSLATRHENSGKMVQAKRVLLDAAKLGSFTATERLGIIFYNEGLDYKRAGNGPAAFKAFKRAMDFGNVEAIGLLGIAYAKQGNNRFEAVALLKRAEKAGAKNSEVKLYLVKALDDLRQGPVVSPRGKKPEPVVIEVPKQPEAPVVIEASEGEWTRNRFDAEVLELVDSYNETMSSYTFSALIDKFPHGGSFKRDHIESFCSDIEDENYEAASYYYDILMNS
tara:strand:- start:102962 stop:103936 length:975 start_codon:yes stop_codon:yes gene_type:complete